MKEVAALHKAEYDTAPEIIIQSPGVIKFIGEHTECFDGLVIAMAASFSVSVAISRRNDSTMRFFAADIGERKRTPTNNLKYKREDRWANYIKAPLSLVTDTQAIQNGFSFTLSGDIPQGLGFSSSTAIILATVLGLKELSGLNLTNEAIKKVILRSEVEFLGQDPGLVEMAACLFANADTAIFGDLRAQTTRLVPFNLRDYVFVITDSKVPRLSVEKETKQRQSDGKACLGILCNQKRQIKSFRDVNIEEAGEIISTFPEVSRRRCTFLMEEMHRVSEAEEALERDDFVTFGRILNRSQDGLRDLYEISCPEIDWLVKRALELEGSLSSRLLGKGFGGCTLSIMRLEAVNEYQKLLEEYERIFGFKATVRIIGPGGRAGIVNP
jgi:galactokinase